jgi:hypothetical protein
MSAVELIPLDIYGQPAAMAPIQAGLAALRETPMVSSTSYAQPLPEHMALSTAISKARRPVVRGYANDVPLLASHIAGPDAIPGMAELVVHTAIPTSAYEMSKASQDPEILEIRARALTRFLPALVELTSGDPYALELQNETNSVVERHVTGQAQAVPLGIFATPHGEICLRTPLIRDGGEMHSDGFIPLSYLATRFNDDILSLNLTAGKEVISTSINGKMAEARQKNESYGAFCAVVDAIDMAAASGLQLSETVTSDDVALAEKLLIDQFVEDNFGLTAFDRAAQGLTRLGDPATLYDRLKRAKAAVFNAIQQLDPTTPMHQVHVVCETAARKNLLLSMIAAQTSRSYDEMRQEARETHEGGDLLTTIKEAYYYVGFRT